MNATDSNALWVATDMGRLFVGTTILLFSSWTDLRWRRAPNVLWIILAGAGVLFALVDFLALPSTATAMGGYLVAAVVVAAVAFGLWWIGIIAGGADAKALAAIAILLPFPLMVGNFPLWPSALPGSLSTLGDALLAFLFIPLAFYVRNAVHGEWRVPHAFLGIRVPVDSVGHGSPAWPMQRVKDGRVVTQWFPSRGSEAPPDIVREELKSAGVTNVWVTPKVPFLVAFLVGFVATFTLGDVLTALVRLVLVRH
ncbi:MAG: A24 family peptidase [Thermoplasmatota archaeon]